MVGAWLRSGVVEQEILVRSPRFRRSLGLRNRPSRGTHVERHGRSLQLNLRGDSVECALLEVGQDLVAPAEPLFVGTQGVPPSLGRRRLRNPQFRVNDCSAGRKHAACADVVLHRQANLLELILALRPAGRFPAA